MSEWTLDKVLNLALSMEEESIKLYSSAQKKVQNSGSKLLLKELVSEEETHKNKILQAIKDPGVIEELGALDKVIHDLKIVDYLVDVPLSLDADYQQILIYAGKREKATHDFYIALAKKYSNKKIGNMFAKLAQEELKHKYKLELEYDDVILKWM